MQNVDTILQSLPSATALIPVLKDDAYGLGMVPIAKALAEKPGIACLAVSHISEGVQLRENGIDREILIMGGAPIHLYMYAVTHRLTLAVGRLDMVPQLAALCRAQHTMATVQLKLDTGLHRYGVAVGEELAALIGELQAHADVITVTGMFSHFSHGNDLELCQTQYDLLQKAIHQVEAAGILIPLGHIASSATSEYAPQFAMDAVRIGRRLYMDHPTAPLGNICECASWQTYITALHWRKAGDTLGYDGVCVLERDTLVATIGVGYGDGLHQGLVNCHAPALVHGQQGKLLACCMDQSVMDVTGIPCAVGDVVTLFGYDDQGNFLSSQELSLLVGGDEGCGLTSMLSHRVEREYTIK